MKLRAICILLLMPAKAVRVTKQRILYRGTDRSVYGLKDLQESLQALVAARG